MSSHGSLVPSYLRKGLLGLLVFAAGAAGADAQFSPAPTPLSVYVYTLRHQPASEAMALVGSLLSVRGSVELQAENNNIVVRDTLSVVSRVAVALQAFDHPVEKLRLEIKIIRAGPSQVADQDTGLPVSLLLKLSELFRYEAYSLEAAVELEAEEGVEISHQVGKEFLLKFRVGTILEDRRIRLAGFRLARATASPTDRPLVATNLTPWLDQTTIVGLAQEEGSRSPLLVAVTCRRARPETGPH